MAEAIFWFLTLAFLVTTAIGFRAAIRGPRGPGRITVAIGVILFAFPWVRSWLSADGRGAFHPSNALAQFEWLLVGLALVPIQLVCLYVILTNRKTVTNG